MLDALGEWRTPDEIAKRFPQYTTSSVAATLAKLLNLGLIVTPGSPAARREGLLAPWSAWGEEARFLHFVTKHTFRRGARSDELRANAQRLQRRLPPPVVKTYTGAIRVSLPPCDSRLLSEFPQTLLKRRTVRAFGLKPPNLEDLSLLLRLTFGFTSQRHWPGLGSVPLRTSPSGGARQTIEAYLVALKNHRPEYKRGIYHYRADRHELELIRAAVNRDQVVRWCAGQTWIGDASVLVVLTAVLPRLMWRYPTSRAYRVLMLEAGHFCQTFCLVATWLGLAPFSTAALDDERLETDLGIDGASETVLYVAGVGTRRNGQRPRNESIKGSVRSRSTSRVQPSRRPSR